MERIGYGILFIVPLIAACNEGEPSHPAIPQPCSDLSSTTALRRVRRLADREVDAVVGGLLEEPTSVFSGIAPDPRVEGFDTDARALIVSSPKLDAYLGSVETVAPRLVAKIACKPTELGRDCATRFIDTFGARAFGRPLADDERQALLSSYAGASSPDVGMRVLAESILLAPSTLYRTEIGQREPEGGTNVTFPPGLREAALDEWELASQLSFLITGTRPDEALRQAAARHELRDVGVVRDHAKRLLATQEAREQLERFVIGWLELGNFETTRRSGVPMFTPAVKAAMQHELERFVDHVVFDGSGTLDELLTSATSYGDPELAPVYGSDLLGTPGAGRPVPLDPHHRKGLLSMPMFLTGHATRDATNPVDRGLFVRTRLLCQEMGAPPKQAFAVPIAPASDHSTTTRDKYLLHTQDPMCKGCHQLMDPIGFGFESFDAIGRFRTKENGFAIDDSGSLAGADVDGPFHGPAELADKLVASKEVRACFVKHLYRFAEAGPVASSSCALDETAKEFAASGSNVQDLILTYVTRRDFFVRALTPEDGP